MPSLTPHLIKLVASALPLGKYPNLFYSSGRKNFSLFCPRKGSREWAKDENIQIFKDWDFSRKRGIFHYSSSRQRVLNALKKSVYLTLLSNEKNIYEFRFNSSQETAAKREALKKERRSKNYGSDGDSIPPSSPELSLSPASDFSTSQSPGRFMDSPPHQEMNMSDHLPLLSSEAPVQVNGSLTHLPSDIKPVLAESSFVESSANFTASQSPLGLENNNLYQGSNFTAGLEYSSSLMETCANVAITSQQSTFTPYEFKELSLGDELADVTGDIEMSEEFYDVTQHEAPVNSVDMEETALPKSNEHALTVPSSLQWDYSVPSSPHQENIVQLKIDEIVSSHGDVRGYLVSVKKVLDIPVLRGTKPDSLNVLLTVADV